MQEVAKVDGLWCNGGGGADRMASVADANGGLSGSQGGGSVWRLSLSGVSDEGQRVPGLSIVRSMPPPGDRRRVQLRVFQQLVRVLVPVCEFPVREEGTKRRRRGCVCGCVSGENVGCRTELSGDERHQGK